jgi:hypothetical protein
MSEKSILEQALLQVQTLEEAVKQNAKGILASTMKQELNDLLKESLEEEEEVEPTEEETDVEEQPEPEEEEGDDMSPEASDDDVDDENLDNLDNEDPMKKIDDESDDESDDEFGDESDDEFGDEFGDESDEFGDESDDDVMDMTGASDDEVLRVFKAMKPEDGVVVKKDGNQIDIDLGDDEYIIKLDEEGDDFEMSEGDVMPDMDVNEDFGMEEENIYEIDIEEEVEEEEEVHKIEATEAARTKSNPHGNKNGMNRAGLPSKKKYKAGSGVFGINEQVEKLKQQNSEYKKALVLFKDKLNEVAVFNANLAYATRLFTEHSTTKQEKLNILKRFDSVSTMNESKGLYNTIKSELVTKKPVTESVVEKISNTPSTSASQQVLSESKAYENPQFKRMKDLMSKIK